MNTLPGGLSLIVHLLIIVIGWLRDQIRKAWNAFLWIFFRKTQYGPVAQYQNMLNTAPVAPVRRSVPTRFFAYSIIVTIMLISSILGWQLLKQALDAPSNYHYATILAITVVHIGTVNPVQ